MQVVELLGLVVHRVAEQEVYVVWVLSDREVLVGFEVELGLGVIHDLIHDFVLQSLVLYQRQRTSSDSQSSE